MSKLIKIYEDLKKQNSEKIYLFKSGLFYIFIGEDAKTMSEVFNFKLTKLNEEYSKCGFPASSFEKYANLIVRLNYDVEVVEPNENTIFSTKDYSTHTEVFNLLKETASIDTDSLTPKESYVLLDEIKGKCKILLDKYYSEN